MERKKACGQTIRKTTRKRRLDHQVTATTPDGMLAEFLEWAKKWPRALREQYLGRIQSDPDHVNQLGIVSLTAEKLATELRKVWGR